MVELATIRLPRVVRDRLRDAAKAARLTQSQLIEEMLDQRRKAEFWAALEAEIPDQQSLTILPRRTQHFGRRRGVRCPVRGRPVTQLG